MKQRGSVYITHFSFSERPQSFDEWLATLENEINDKLGKNFFFF